MRLGGVLAAAGFFMICSGWADGALGRARIDRGRAAALCALCTLLSPLETGVWLIRLHPSSLALAAAGLMLPETRRARERAALYALVFGLLGWLTHAAFPAAEETGALTAIPAALLAGLMLREPRERLCATLLAPMCFGLAAAVEEWYLFDTLLLPLGGPAQLDAQACGAAGAALLGRLYGAAGKAKRMRQTAKNS